MIEFESRQIIKGFGSGVLSKAASQYFSFAWPGFLPGPGLRWSAPPKPAKPEA